MNVFLCQYQNSAYTIQTRDLFHKVIRVGCVMLNHVRRQVSWVNALSFYYAVIFSGFLILRFVYYNSLLAEIAASWMKYIKFLLKGSTWVNVLCYFCSCEALLNPGFEMCCTNKVLLIYLIAAKILGELRETTKRKVSLFVTGSPGGGVRSTAEWADFF